jgi:hypothetical protein
LYETMLHSAKDAPVRVDFRHGGNYITVLRRRFPAFAFLLRRDGGRRSAFCFPVTKKAPQKAEHLCA